ncbi:DNA-processing protein DprA [Paenibacillus pasadenensis]|uniref:DNA-processing protein DprA n=1 Tax=Paenibacillus pasadenensis TaxID=217090 RepID=UPI00203BDF31|nr:DNA-processing protein DprA [Paenibacillus pasadenensis]MCM3746022.1 DNA-processing protein DprA [Paenibacillus pasadenensis]
MIELSELEMNGEQRERARAFLIRMHETPGIGWQSVNRAVQAGCWFRNQVTTEQLERAGIRNQYAGEAAKRIADSYTPGWEAEFKARGGTRITVLDAEYPELLKQIPQPPWVLYAIGRLELLSGPCLSIVGTRGPTAYGKQSASKFSAELASIGYVIVSGMAKGIDGISHLAAMDSGGGTIAVLGTPIDTVYPPDHRALYRRIANDGLLLSEFPIGTPVKPGMFPQRNRIIAGLSLGTLVIEAAAGSGSLITADQALEMNREVYAVPGPVNSPKSAGCNGLIREGRAQLVTGGEQIAEDFRHLAKPLQAQSSKLEVEPELTADEQRIFSFIQEEPRSADRLYEASDMAFGLLQTVLINLCLKRKIELHNGSIYMAL